jgi:hypothetical protein
MDQLETKEVVNVAACLGIDLEEELIEYVLHLMNPVAISLRTGNKSQLTDFLHLVFIKVHV